jgi:hypothetical protein
VPSTRLRGIFSVECTDVVHDQPVLQAFAIGPRALI